MLTLNALWTNTHCLVGLCIIAAYGMLHECSDYMCITFHVAIQILILYGVLHRKDTARYPAMTYQELPKNLQGMPYHEEPTINPSWQMIPDISNTVIDKYFASRRFTMEQSLDLSRDTIIRRRSSTIAYARHFQQAGVGINNFYSNE